MSNAPHIVRGGNNGDTVQFSTMESVMMQDGLIDAFTGESMGNTGETVALEHDISRKKSDSFAVRSHALANEAWANGWLASEVFTVGPLEMDEGIRPDTNEEVLSKLKTVFRDQGQVTAGNSSQVSDGGSAVLIASEHFANEHGLPVLAKIVDYTTSGVEPQRVMSAPIPAVNRLLQMTKMDIDDIDILEHNEAFASASCAVRASFSFPEESFNPHGGAIAIGHPLGATGARCLMTLVNALIRTKCKRGVVTVCLGGGNAVAMMVETPCPYYMTMPVIDLIWGSLVAGSMVEPARAHTRFEKARIIGARALQISMGAPLFVSEDELRDKFSEELIQLYGVDDAKEKVVLDPMKIATLEYEQNRIPIDIDPHFEEE